MLKKESIIQKVFAIESDIFRHYTKDEPISLMTGAGGMVLFYFHLFRHFKSDVYLDKASIIIEDIVEKVSSSNQPHNYSDGIAGVAFLLNYLKEKEFLGEEIDDFLLQLDDVLYNTANEFLIKYRHYDYLHGGLGIVLYFLQRAKHNPECKRKSVELGGILLDIVKKEISGEIVVNSSYDKNGNLIKHTNCGLAHGMVGIIMFLCKYLPISQEKSLVTELLAKCVKEILQFQSKNPQSLSQFPSIVHENAAISYNTPLGWCYGDGSISLALWNAAEILGDEDLKSNALQIALLTLKRNSMDSAGISDACFCHGTSSVAHIYHKWYKLTGVKEFYDGYMFWLDSTIQLGSFDDGIGGFKKYAGDGQFACQLGLLDGASGIGLTLLDALTIEDSEWDHFFLLS